MHVKVLKFNMLFYLKFEMSLLFSRQRGCMANTKIVVIACAIKVKENMLACHLLSHTQGGKNKKEERETKKKKKKGKTI